MRKINLLLALFIFIALTSAAEAVSADTGLDTAQRAEIVKLISQLEARIAELQEKKVGAIVTIYPNSTTRITSVSRIATPLIHGQAEGLEKISLAIFNHDKQIYETAEINTENGLWSHQVTTPLPLGDNEFVLYVNNTLRQKFTLPFQFTVAELRIDLNGRNVLSVEDVSKEEARSKCVIAYGGQSPYLFKTGDTLVCQWNGEIFAIVNK